MSSPSSDVITRSQFIRAGAGAGKTTKLINTFLDFVHEFKLKNNRFPRVVLTTFTRKATQEVKERLLVTALLKDEKEVFEYINKKSYVHISTIHGLLSLYLAQYAERLQFPQQIVLIDAIKYSRNLKKNINEIFKKSPKYIELLEHFNFVQLVELATKTLDFKAQNSEIGFVNKEELIKISGQKKNELIEKILKITNWVSDVPPAWSEYFNYLQSLLVLLQQNNESEFLERIEQAPAKPRWSNAKPPFEPLAHALIEEFREQVKSDLFSTEIFIDKHEALNALYFDFINELFELVISYKKNTGELTISDLENISLQLVREHPDTAEEFSSSWDYFMIDEYQDTSPLQVKLLNSIIQNKPCFIVGDPQQSIYLFRGARAEVFTTKQNEMISQNSHIELLETNYRSRPSLMKFINNYFQIFSPQFKPMRVKNENIQTGAELFDAYYIKCTEQTHAVLSHIQHFISLDINPADICVLSRNNSKLIEIAVLANKVSVPVQLQAASGFEEKREILDLIAFNKFLNNPHDDENLVTLLRSPWLYVSDQELLDLFQNPANRQSSLWTAIAEKKSDSYQKLLKYSELFDLQGALQTTKEFITDTAFVLCSNFYDKTGKREANIFKFLVSLAQAEKSKGFSLGLFLEEQFQTLQSDLGASNVEAQPVLQPNCVSLMTVHASKGLQFKHVIVIGFSDAPTLSKISKISFDDETQKFSLSVYNDTESKHEASDWAQVLKDNFNHRELNENERVLYVAMTRAIESVALVAEIGKRSPNEKSWYMRSQWPAIGEVKGEGYRAISLNHEAALAAAESEVATSSKARNAFFSDVAINASEAPALNSVTELLTASGSLLKDIDYEKSLINLKKAQKGSELHRIFESLKYLNRKMVLEGLTEVDKKNVTYILNQKDLPIEKILAEGFNEWGFGLKTKTKFIQGQIDLWAELSDEIHIVDYKTGSPVYSEKAFEQLTFYAMALFSMNQISKRKKICLSVIYPIDQIIKTTTYDDYENFLRVVDTKIKFIFMRD